MNNIIFILIFSVCLLSAENTIFGTKSQDTGLTGFLYDLKMKSEMKPSALVNPNGTVKYVEFNQEFERLIKKGFSVEELAAYRSGDESCNLAALAIQMTYANIAPPAFGSDYIEPTGIVIVYRGKVKSAPFQEVRFAGFFDDAMAVLVNDELVFYSTYNEGSQMKSPALSEERKKGNRKADAYGKYVKLKRGDEITIAVAEIPGLMIEGKLAIQKKGHRYKKNSFGDPILHPFSTIKLSTKDKKSLKNTGYIFEFSGIPEFSFEKEK